jgi:[ribosomal protein S5]-alanine N-acetyltransferase
MPINTDAIATSERVYIRQLNFSDQAQLFNMYADKEAMQYRSTAAFESIEEARQMVEKAIEGIEKGNEYRFGIVEKETKELIGTFLYKVIEETKCEIGYSIGKQYWNRGFGYEAIQIMLTYLQQNGFKTAVATTKKPNTASTKLLIKSGFLQTTNKQNEELNWFEKEI